MGRRRQELPSALWWHLRSGASTSADSHGDPWQGWRPASVVRLPRVPRQMWPPRDRTYRRPSIRSPVSRQFPATASNSSSNRAVRSPSGLRIGIGNVGSDPSKARSGRGKPWRREVPRARDRIPAHPLRANPPNSAGTTPLWFEKCSGKRCIHQGLRG
jgi:hypothetical protein